MTDHKITSDEIAAFCERLAKLGAIKRDDLLTFAEDALVNEGGSDRAMMILDGMRAGIQQAAEADKGRRVVAVWYDDNSARATFSWSPRKAVHKSLRAAVLDAMESALREDGASTTQA